MAAHKMKRPGKFRAFAAMPKLKFVFGIKQTGVVVVFFTEFAFVAERNFNVVVDFRSYAYAEFHAETIECFAVNRIGAAVGQGYDRTAGVVDQIISQGKSGFRFQADAVLKFPGAVDSGTENAG